MVISYTIIGNRSHNLARSQTGGREVQSHLFVKLKNTFRCLRCCKTVSVTCLRLEQNRPSSHLVDARRAVQTVDILVCAYKCSCSYSLHGAVFVNLVEDRKCVCSLSQFLFLSVNNLNI